MGVQRKRRRREERLEEEEQGREPAQENVLEKERPKEEATAADRVLDLQKTAGNRAVGAALARWGLPWLPLAAAPQWPKEAQVIVDGKVIPIDSWSWSGGATGAGTGASPTGPGTPELNDISVTTKIGEHSSDLLLRTARGQPFKKVIIVVPGKDGKGMSITLENVMITSYHTSADAHGGNVETWSLSYSKRELSQSPPQVQPRP